MLLLPQFQGNVTPQPAALEHQPRGGCELAKILPKESSRFLRQDSVRRRELVCVRRGRQKLTVHLAVPIDLEKIFVYSATKEFVFPPGQRRTDPKTGIEFCLQPGFELGVQRWMEITSR